MMQVWQEIRNLQNEVRRLRGQIGATHVGNKINASSITGVVPVGGISEIDHLIATVMALPYSDLTIATGAVTITKSHHRIDTEGAASSDDLDTISGAESNQLLILRPVNGARTVVIKHNTGNIMCMGEADISLETQQDWVWLLYDPVATKWYAQAGGGGIGFAQFYIPFGSDADGQDFTP